MNLATKADLYSQKNRVLAVADCRINGSVSGWRNLHSCSLASFVSLMYLG